LKFDAVIFDLYGTIIDFLPDEDYVCANARMAAALGAPAAELRAAWLACAKERGIGAFGGLEDTIRCVCGKVGVHPDDAQIQEAARIRLEIIRRNLAPRDGAVETLTALRSAGLKTALISVAYDEETRVWPDTPFAPLMDAAIWSCDVGLLKPDPAIYQAACERLGVNPETCVFIGAGSFDELAGAKGVGMPSVLIRVDYDRFADHRRTEADSWSGPVITDLRELPAYVAGL
jgi:putative hydrolase of the HAD superfamily